jgi:hypothetical protein
LIHRKTFPELYYNPGNYAIRNAGSDDADFRTGFLLFQEEAGNRFYRDGDHCPPIAVIMIPHNLFRLPAAFSVMSPQAARFRIPSVLTIGNSA